MEVKRSEGVVIGGGVDQKVTSPSLSPSPRWGRSIPTPLPPPLPTPPPSGGGMIIQYDLIYFLGL